MSRGKSNPTSSSGESPATGLREALRRARIETAERSGVIVDLRDAEIARLELLNEALEPVFAEAADGADLFDRGISHGESPRLWIDIVAHVAMARDKRTYRFLQDTRFGRKVLAESPDIASIVEAVTAYAARRMIERERALAGDQSLTALDRSAAPTRARILRAAGLFLFGMASGIVLLFLVAYLVASTLPAR
jgi:hypothetical protein